MLRTKSCNQFRSYPLSKYVVNDVVAMLLRIVQSTCDTQSSGQTLLVTSGVHSHEVREYS
jgi:hypothetical protein